MNWKPWSFEVSPEEFNRVMENHPLVVIHFWAPWNAYDRDMDRLLSEVANDYNDRIFFGAVNVDEPGHSEFCRKQVLNVPALAAFVNGAHIETRIGMLSKTELETKLKQWLEAVQNDQATKSH